MMRIPGNESNRIDRERRRITLRNLVLLVFILATVCVIPACTIGLIEYARIDVIEEMGWQELSTGLRFKSVNVSPHQWLYLSFEGDFPGDRGNKFAVTWSLRRLSVCWFNI